MLLILCEIPFYECQVYGSCNAGTVHELTVTVSTGYCVCKYSIQKQSAQLLSIYQPG